MSVPQKSEIGAKVELYIASLWLLFFLVILLTAEIPTCFGAGCEFIGWAASVELNIVPLFSALMLALGAVFVARFEYTVGRDTDLPVEVVGCSDLNYEHLTFLTTYIVPLVSFNLASSRYMLTLAVLLVVIGVIYVRTDKFYTNPTLALLGFRLYKIDLGGPSCTRGVVIITRDSVEVGSFVSLKFIDKNVAFGGRRS